MSQVQNSNCILEDLPSDDIEMDIEMPHLVLFNGPHDDDGDSEDSKDE